HPASADRRDGGRGRLRPVQGLRDAERHTPDRLLASELLCSSFGVHSPEFPMPAPIRLLLVVALTLGLSENAWAQSSRPTALSELSRSFEALAEKVSPSVVQIFVTAYALPD